MGAEAPQEAVAVVTSKADRGSAGGEVMARNAFVHLFIHTLREASQGSVPGCVHSDDQVGELSTCTGVEETGQCRGHESRLDTSGKASRRRWGGAEPGVS